MKKPLFAIVIMLLLSGCTGIAPAVYKFDKEKVYDASFDAIWAAVIEFFADHSIPVDNMEKASGYISTDKIEFDASYTDCGKTPIGVSLSGGAIGNCNVFVKKCKNNKVKVKVTTRYRNPSKEDNSYYSGCVSTGKLERLIFSALDNNLEK